MFQVYGLKTRLVVFKKSMKRALVASFCLFFPVCFVVGCFNQSLQNITNICSIFNQDDRWLKAAQRSEKRWGVKASILLAFVYQESRFQSHAKPPRKKLLGIIPWKKPSSAFGYAQATDDAWVDYKRSTKQTFVSRSNIKDSIDFVGWYNHRSHKLLGIPKDNAYALYLAYHEGPTGFQKGTFKRKPNVRHVASKVSERAKHYDRQYSRC